jgi:hypothetical protein
VADRERIEMMGCDGESGTETGDLLYWRDYGESGRLAVTVGDCTPLLHRPHGHNDIMMQRDRKAI